MATSHTRLRKKPAEKVKVIDRLLAVKRTPLVTSTIETAALGQQWVSGGRLKNLERDMRVVQQQIAQVKDIRDRLADVPALPQRGSVL